MSNRSPMPSVSTWRHRRKRATSAKRRSTKSVSHQASTSSVPPVKRTRKITETTQSKKPEQIDSSQDVPPTPSVSVPTPVRPGTSGLKSTKGKSKSTTRPTQAISGVGILDARYVRKTVGDIE